MAESTAFQFSPTLQPVPLSFPYSTSQCTVTYTGHAELASTLLMKNYLTSRQNSDQIVSKTVPVCGKNGTTCFLSPHLLTIEERKYCCLLSSEFFCPHVGNNLCHCLEGTSVIILLGCCTHSPYQFHPSIQMPLIDSVPPDNVLVLCNEYHHC